MPELKREVIQRNYRLEYACDTEGCSGSMVCSTMTLTSNPPQSPHACRICGVNRNFFKRYPSIETVFEEIPVE